jgi:Phosphoglycerate dehydrogenase and related dehydrogenases
MTRVLLLLNMPEQLRNKFHRTLARSFPNLSFDLVENVSKVDSFLADAEILMTHGPYLSTRADYVLGHMPNLRWIQGTGTGVDNIIDRPSLPANVLVTNMRGAHGPQMSEAAIASMLALSRKIPRTIRNQDKRVWERWLPGIIHGKTVGILGVGVIAEALAPRCKALGMTVVGLSTSPRDIAGFDRMHPIGELKDVAAGLDFFVLLTPYSTATHHIVNEAVLMGMKQGSYLVNLARGGVVDETALIKALEQGPLNGAALDVFATEPLPADHRFWSMENVIITCHIGGLTDDYDLQAVPIIETNLHHYLNGEPDRMLNVVRSGA